MCNIVTANATKDRFPYITTDVSFASVVESHRVKIGKVQSARRRHWRDVKENESGQKGNCGERWRIEKKRERGRDRSGKSVDGRSRGRYCFRGAQSDCVRFYGTRQLARNESIVREKLNRVPPRI